VNFSNNRWARYPIVFSRRNPGLKFLVTENNIFQVLTEETTNQSPSQAAAAASSTAGKFNRRHTSQMQKVEKKMSQMTLSNRPAPYQDVNCKYNSASHVELKFGNAASAALNQGGYIPPHHRHSQAAAPLRKAKPFEKRIETDTKFASTLALELNHTSTPSIEVVSLSIHQECESETFPLLKCGGSFQVFLHKEGETEHCTVLASDLAWSNQHVYCPELVEQLVDFSDWFVVTPTYVNDKFEKFRDKFHVELEVQSMVTGGIHMGGETPTECCQRELYEEIGLAAPFGQEILQIETESKNVRLYICALIGKAPPRSPQTGKKPEDDKSKKIGCIPLVKNLEEIYCRSRVQAADKDIAGETVAVIQVRDYIQLLKAFNLHKQPKHIKNKLP